MPKICYQFKKFDPKTAKIINTANAILDEYVKIAIMPLVTCCWLVGEASGEYLLRSPDAIS